LLTDRRRSGADRIFGAGLAAGMFGLAKAKPKSDRSAAAGIGGSRRRRGISFSQIYIEKGSA